MKRNIYLAFALIIAIVLFVYGFIGVLGADYNFSNIMSVATGFLGLVGFLYEMIRDAHNDKAKIDNKKEETYRQLSAKYEKYSNVKSYINDNLDRNGKLKDEQFRTNNGRPTKVEVEDFMRFFKDLKWEIECHNIDWETAKKKFSKYALIVHTTDFFRSDIEDYFSPDWKDFRDYCEHILEMK